MSPKTGRPPKYGKTRTVKINIRMTEEEAKDVQYCSDKLEKSRTDVLMYGIKLVKSEIDNKKQS